jgi:hypothetical protein
VSKAAFDTFYYFLFTFLGVCVVLNVEGVKAMKNKSISIILAEISGAVRCRRMGKRCYPTSFTPPFNQIISESKRKLEEKFKKRRKN